MKVFISYSHHDEWALDALHMHLAMLRREEKIVEWYDRELLAGSNLTEEIEQNLNDSDIYLALVSPHFIASDYCYDKEMKAALELHSKAKILVVPIIIEPCDWLNSPLKTLLATPKDGKAITEWDQSKQWLVNCNFGNKKNNRIDRS